MSARNMAKRTAAGTLALAVCLGGGAIALAGAANALPVAVDATVSSSTGANGVPAAQIIRSSNQSLSDFEVTFAAGSGTTPVWKTNDRVIVQLPANVSWASNPTVTAVKVSGDGTTAPTFSLSQVGLSDDPTTDLNGSGTAGNGGDDAVSSVRQLAITFTNTQPSVAAEVASSWKFKISGVKVDASSFTGGAIGFGGSDATVSATGDANGKIFGQVYDANGGTYTSSPVYSDQTGGANTTDVIGYAQDTYVGIGTGFSLVNGGGVQAAPDVTLTEVAATSWSGSGQATISFKDSAGTAVALDATSSAVGSTYGPSITVNGTALTSGSVTFGGSNTTLQTPSITSTSSTDKVVIGNLRFANPSSIVGPVKAYLTVNSLKAVATAVSGVAGNQGVTPDGVTVNDPNARLGGATRFDTAAQIATTRFPAAWNGSTFTAGNAQTEFVLANGDGEGVDALSANYVAGAGTDKPVLLTSKTWLPDATLAYLKSHVAAGNTTTPVQLKFTVMGGKGAIDDAVIGQIKDAFPNTGGYNVTINRQAGDDRYATAASAAINVGAGSIASFSNTYGKAAVRTAILASGEVSADAVVAGGIAYGGNFPLLLTAKGELPKATSDALSTLEIKQVIIVGGPNAISQGVEDKLKGMGITIIRVYGQDRFGTAIQIAEFARTPVVSTDTKKDAGLGWNQATYNATGTTWGSTTVPLLGNGERSADILAAGQLSGNGANTYRPILTTGGDSLNSDTKAWLKNHRISVTSVTGVGGSSVLAWPTLTAAVDAQS